MVKPLHVRIPKLHSSIGDAIKFGPFARSIKHDLPRGLQDMEADAVMAGSESQALELMVMSSQRSAASAPAPQAAPPRHGTFGSDFTIANVAVRTNPNDDLVSQSRQHVLGPHLDLAELCLAQSVSLTDFPSCAS